MRIPVSSPARASDPARLTGLGLALALGLVLLVLSYARIYGDSQSAMLQSGVFTSLFADSIWGTALATNLILFACAQVLLHVGFGLLIWGLARVSWSLWPSQTTRVAHHVFLWFLGVALGVLASNAANIPHSSLGEPYAGAMQSGIAGVQAWGWIALPPALAVLLTLAEALRRWLLRDARARKPLAAVAAFAAIATTVAIVLPARSAGPMPAKPSVILIGLDSLRADLIAPGVSPSLTPNVTRFLKGGATFSNAMTPLARTFPSMTSILTGRRPHTTGAIVNLLPRDLVHEGETLSRLLARSGYATAYATDEVRFSNIDATYGFDTTVTPPIGASEFLISVLADTPLSNHVVNTWLGAILFPHVHANRGAAVTYDPDRFIRRVESEIGFRQPMFLTVHMTLSHWPYTWIDSPLKDQGANESPGQLPWPKYYRDAVQRADRQFGDLLAMLERRGMLQNAIVVVYSDHGESFGYDSELLPPHDASAMTSLGEVSRWGHGTSVLIPQQYGIVLGVRGYGPSRFRSEPGSRFDAPVATYDIAPTIADLLALQPQDRYDGRSFGALLREEPDAAAAFAGRIRFTETEFTPSNLATQTGSVSASVLARVAAFYDVDGKTDRLEIRRHIVPTLFKVRHFAAVGDHWLLAAIPGGADAGFRYLVVDMKSGKPERLTSLPEAGAQPELHRLWDALHAEFGSTIGPADRMAQNR